MTLSSRSRPTKAQPAANLPLTAHSNTSRKPRRCNAIGAAKSPTGLPRPHVLIDDLNVGFDAANLRRCAGCGGMVYLWPCLACSARKAA